jgi:hypothetical protein
MVNNKGVREKCDDIYKNLKKRTIQASSVNFDSVKQ